MTMTENERLSLPIWKRIILYTISLIVFSAQLAVIYFTAIAFVNTNRSVNYVFFVIQAVALLQVFYVINKPISANYKLTWAICLLILPLPFLMLYYFNATSRKMSQRKKNIIHKAVMQMPTNTQIDELKDDRVAYNLAKIVSKDTFAPVYGDSKFKFYNDCYEKFMVMLDDIKKATDAIFMEFFILSPGWLMDNLYEALLERGKNGVQIRIIYDDVGSKGPLHRKLVKKLARIPNCRICKYQPLGLNLNLLLNYRDHRKIVVIDYKIAYCGGDNLADEYIHKKERFGYWRDNCGRYEGQIVNSFVVLFSEMWYTSTKEALEVKKVEYERFENEGYVLAFGDGPLFDNNPSYDLFRSLIINAKRYVYISTPYFIIDDAMIELIALKAKEGVDVRILMPHIPDKKAAFYMGRANYREIIKAGGKIYEMTRGFNHAKNIIVDDKYAFIGTVNMDYRSLFLHYECGALIIGSKEILKMKEDYDNEIKDSLLITYEMWKKRPLNQKITAFILNMFAPLF